MSSSAAEPVCAATACSTLPPELLIIICEKAEKTTIKRLRLACRLINRSASPFLFERVYISSYAADWEAALSIAADHYLARRVRQLVWDDTGVPPRDPPIKQVIYGKMSFDANQGLSIWTTRGLSETEYENLTQFHTFSRLVCRRGLDRQLIRSILPSLINLRSILWTDMYFTSMRTRIFGASPAMLEAAEHGLRVLDPDDVDNLDLHEEWDYTLDRWQNVSCQNRATSYPLYF